LKPITLAEQRNFETPEENRHIRNTNPDMAISEPLFPGTALGNGAEGKHDTPRKGGSR